MTAALRTRLVRAADGPDFAVRQGLHALRTYSPRENLVGNEPRDFEPRRARDYYPTTPRRCNVLVPLEVGTGQDAAAVARAIKLLSRKMADSGTLVAVSRVKIATRAGRNKFKKKQAAKRRSKAQLRAAQREAMRGDR